MQPPVLMNRFMINLKSLSTTRSSQGSSAGHLSRFSAPNFRIPDSFLGNIGEDLQHGHEHADGDNEEDHEMRTMPPITQGSPEVELEDSSTSPALFISHPEGAQVSVCVHPGLKRSERALLHSAYSPG